MLIPLHPIPSAGIHCHCAGIRAAGFWQDLHHGHPYLHIDVIDMLFVSASYTPAHPIGLQCHGACVRPDRIRQDLHHGHRDQRYRNRLPQVGAARRRSSCCPVAVRLHQEGAEDVRRAAQGKASGAFTRACTRTCVGPAPHLNPWPNHFLHRCNTSRFTTTPLLICSRHPAAAPALRTWPRSCKSGRRQMGR